MAKDVPIDSLVHELAYRIPVHIGLPLFQEAGMNPTARLPYAIA
jgi:hypothetical protein